MIVGGIDEVGRGALAGPIIAVCAIFEFTQELYMGRPPVVGLADSKSFSTETKREAVFQQLVSSPLLLDFAVGECSVAEIDASGIDHCNSVVFQRAIMGLKHVPDMVYVDGDKPIAGWPAERQHVEPQADGKYWPVSAASIIAKVVRDRLMRELHRFHPGYVWGQNKGYGSVLHTERIRLNGPSEHHRRQFIQKIVAKRT